MTSRMRQLAHSDNCSPGVSERVDETRDGRSRVVRLTELVQERLVPASRRSLSHEIRNPFAG